MTHNLGTKAREKRAETHSNTLEASEKKMKSMLQRRKWFGGGSGHSGLGNFGVSDSKLEGQRTKVRAAKQKRAEVDMHFYVEGGEYIPGVGFKDQQDKTHSNKKKN